MMLGTQYTYASHDALILVLITVPCTLCKFLNTWALAVLGLWRIVMCCACYKGTL